jgi:hypothetical protein
MHPFLPQVLYTASCLSKLYTDNIFVKKLVNDFKERKRKTAQIGTICTASHPEGPATGQLDQGFPWFSLVPEQMLSWYPNSTLYCMLHMQPSQW